MDDLNLPNEKYAAARVVLCRHLKKMAAEKGITHEQIAERTGFLREHVSRMLSGKFAPKLDNFLKIAEAIGCYFFISDKEADDDLSELMRKRYQQGTSDN